MPCWHCVALRDALYTPDDFRGGYPSLRERVDQAGEYTHGVDQQRRRGERGNVPASFEIGLEACNVPAFPN
jgi:hypothetical protein